ncbi:MAG: TerD family protein [Leptotrichiaceae bacterium]|nr:TerD family protein [Leptotrichiaceae bacterium]
MAITLEKGQKIDLTKTNPGLKKLHVGLGWDTNKYDGGADFDLDAAAFILNSEGKVGGEQDFVFYNNANGAGGSVIHKGDNKTGVGEGDDEVISIDLSLLPSHVDKVVFTVTIHDAESRKQNFGQVSNAYIRVLNEEKNEEILKFDLGEDFSIETAVVFGEVYKNGSEWKFSAIGKGYQGGLKALCNSFGLSV